MCGYNAPCGKSDEPVSFQLEIELMILSTIFKLTSSIRTWAMTPFLGPNKGMDEWMDGCWSACVWTTLKNCFNYLSLNSQQYNKCLTERVMEKRKFRNSMFRDQKSTRAIWAMNPTPSYTLCFFCMATGSGLQHSTVFMRHGLGQSEIQYIVH